MERPVSEVPKATVAVLALALAAQLGFKGLHPPEPPAAEDLPAPPSVTALRLASLGDPIPLAKVLMLYLQAYDYRAGNRIPFQDLDYGRLETWLARILDLDPAGQYPLMAASRLYAEVPDEAKERQMLEFIYNEFQRDPDHRWPWLAHAAVIAKHRLKDLPLALRYAAAIQQHAKGKDVPIWAKQMEAFILEDMNELQEARIMIGGFIASGMVQSPGELRFLEERLKQIEARIAKEKR